MASNTRPSGALLAVLKTSSLRRLSNPRIIISPPGVDLTACWSEALSPQIGSATARLCSRPRPGESGVGRPGWRGTSARCATAKCRSGWRWWTRPTGGGCVADSGCRLAPAFVGSSMQLLCNAARQATYTMQQPEKSFSPGCSHSSPVLTPVRLPPRPTLPRPSSCPEQVIQARLAALEEDNHKEEDFAAGSDDEEFELPAGSDDGAPAELWTCGAACRLHALLLPTATLPCC